MHRNAWEAVSEQPPAAFVELDELHGSEVAGGVEAEGVSADVAEKVEDIHFSLS